MDLNSLQDNLLLADLSTERVLVPRENLATFRRIIQLKISNPV